MLAWATAYCAFAPQNCGLVTPKISSPFLNPLALGPASSTTPDKSEPSVSGGVGLTLLLPSRMSASHGPTPEAATLIRSSPAAGAGRGTSSTTTTSGAPKRWIRAAFMFEPSLRIEILVEAAVSRLQILAPPARRARAWLLLKQAHRRCSANRPEVPVGNAPRPYRAGG